MSTSEYYPSPEIAAATERIHQWLRESLAAKLAPVAKTTEGGALRVAKEPKRDSCVYVTAKNAPRPSHNANRKSRAKTGAAPVCRTGEPAWNRKSVPTGVLFELRAKGLSYEQIGKQTGMHPSTVHQRLKGRPRKYSTTEAA